MMNPVAQEHLTGLGITSNPLKNNCKLWFMMNQLAIIKRN